MYPRHRVERVNHLNLFTEVERYEVKRKNILPRIFLCIKFLNFCFQKCKIVKTLVLHRIVNASPIGHQPKAVSPKITRGRVLKDGKDLGHVSNSVRSRERNGKTHYLNKSKWE